MAKTVTEETKKSLARSFPYGDKWEKRKVIRVYDKNKAWYRKGQILTVKYFATFGCYDIKGRWIDYYDLGLPLTENDIFYAKWYVRFINWIIKLFK